MLKSIIEELKESGVITNDIIDIQLDARENRNINKPEQLDKLIEDRIKDKNFKYIFIDEVQNVIGFEKIIESYRNENNYSIFITGSNL